MRRTRVNDPEFSEINITPLTDVVLVLLLIFMVATPALVSQSLPVAVPEAGTAEEAPPPTATVSIDAERRVYLEEREVLADSLEAGWHLCWPIRRAATWSSCARTRRRRTAWSCMCSTPSATPAPAPSSAWMRQSSSSPAPPAPWFTRVA